MRYFFGTNNNSLLRLEQINENFRKLNFTDIQNVYKNSKNRLLFFDYEGTLPSDYHGPEFVSRSYPPSSSILKTLEKLTNDTKNNVCIVAGKGHEPLRDWFGGLKHLCLAAEHGFKYLNRKISDNFVETIKDFKNDWIEECSTILNEYCKRFEGSFLDKKRSSLVFQYTDCDQELGKKYEISITSQLDKLRNKYGFKIKKGKGFMELLSKNVDKGHFVEYILKEVINNKQNLDFILCIGDDTNDEKMFDYLNQKINIIKKYYPNIKIYCIIVGKKPSYAQYYVDTPKEVEELLNKLAESK